MEGSPKLITEFNDEFFKHFVMENYVGGQVGYPVHSQSLEITRGEDFVEVKLFPNQDEVSIVFTFKDDGLVVESPVLYAGLVEEGINEKYKKLVKN